MDGKSCFVNGLTVRSFFFWVSSKALPFLFWYLMFANRIAIMTFRTRLYSIKKCVWAVFIQMFSDSHERENNLMYPKHYV